MQRTTFNDKTCAVTRRSKKLKVLKLKHNNKYNRNIRIQFTLIYNNLRYSILSLFKVLRNLNKIKVWKVIFPIY